VTDAIVTAHVGTSATSCSGDYEFKSTSCHVEMVSGGPEEIVLYPVAEGHEAGG